MATTRRGLPPGGIVPEDYAFQGAAADSTPTDVLLSELFTPGKDSLVTTSGRAPQTPGTSADARARPRRGRAPRCRSGHATLGPRRARDLLPDAARDDPRSGHRAAPSIRAVLRLRAGSVPRTAGHPATRPGHDRDRTISDRRSHGGRLVRLDLTPQGSGSAAGKGRPRGPDGSRAAQQRRGCRCYRDPRKGRRQRRCRPLR